jgi:hypothetical protein
MTNFLHSPVFTELIKKMLIWYTLLYPTKIRYLSTSRLRVDPWPDPARSLSKKAAAVRRVQEDATAADEKVSFSAKISSHS